MNRRSYRICLIVMIIAAICTGVFYYRFLQKKELDPRDGIFVEEFFSENGVGSEVI